MSQVEIAAVMVAYMVLGAGFLVGFAQWRLAKRSGADPMWFVAFVMGLLWPIFLLMLTARRIGWWLVEDLS